MGLTSNNISTYRAGGLTEAGVEYINSVRASPPARRVGGTRFLSVSCRFPSQKMGCTIQAESRTGEYPFVQLLELDDDVIEFYDQPKHVSVTRIRAGRRHVSPYTPDFLVLRTQHVEVIEIKPRQIVEDARAKHPNEWTQRDGRWVNLPVAAIFDPVGIHYWVHVAEDIDSVLAANLNLLISARNMPPHAQETLLIAKAKKFLGKDVVATIHVIVNELGLADASVIFRWIATGIFHAATSHQLLSNIRATRVFLDKDSAKRFTDALNVNVTVGPKKISGNDPKRSSEDFDRCKISATLATEALTDRQSTLALTRYKATLPAILGERAATRNERRLIKRMNDAIASGLGPLPGFVPKFHKQGNHVPRITSEQEEHMAAAAKAYYFTPARRSARWVYAAIDWGDIPVASYKAFQSFIRKTPKHEAAGARWGHRAWLAERPQSHPNTRAIWPTFAWELVHIDHTPIDEKVWGKLGVAQVLGRPWLTTMIDGWSKTALAFSLSFSSPSWESLAMLLRDCVRRHRRLPIAWISDQGSEFGGTYWETFSAAHACVKLDRAVADARCGSQVEGSFNQLHRDLINQLDGNMQNDREWRSATASHKSNATARYCMERIYEAIDGYLFKYYNDKPQGPNTFSPLQNFVQSESDLGPIVAKIDYGLRFRIETAKKTEKKTHRIGSRRGMRIGKQIYWHADFAQPRFDGKAVEVRLEPFDSSLVYAHLDGKWVECVSAKHAELTCLEEFGRWAQSAIDYYGKSYSASIKRAADEQFVREQVERWKVIDADAQTRLEISSSVEEENATVFLTSNDKVAIEIEGNKTPSNAASPFEHLRALKLPSLNRREP